MVKEGTATDKDLNNAWQSIYNEYADLTDSDFKRRVIAFEKEISRLFERNLEIRTACLVLSVKYSKYFIDRLRTLGYNYEFNYVDKSSFESDLIRVLNVSKSLSITLANEEKKYADYIENNKGIAVTEEYYEDCLTAISQFMKIDYNADTIKVAKFINILKRMNKYNESLSKQNGK